MADLVSAIRVIIVPFKSIFVNPYFALHQAVGLLRLCHYPGVFRARLMTAHQGLGACSVAGEAYTSNQRSVRYKLTFYQLCYIFNKTSFSALAEGKERLYGMEQ
jgi:hypothetical protein